MIAVLLFFFFCFENIGFLIMSKHMSEFEWRVTWGVGCIFGRYEDDRRGVGVAKLPFVNFSLKDDIYYRNTRHELQITYLFGRYHRK